MLQSINKDCNKPNAEANNGSITRYRELQNGNELLVNGFIKEFQTIMNNSIHIPSPVIQLVILYYPILYKIYGIGPNNDEYAQSGLLMSNVFKSFRYSEYKPLSITCDNMYEIHFFMQDILLMNTVHQIFRKHSVAKWQYNRDTMKDTLSLMHSPNIHNNKDYISAISNGITARHSIMVTNSGMFYGFGENDKGQLGIGNTINMGPLKEANNIQPLPIYNTYNLLKNVTICRISCGLKHTLFLTTNGNVMSCGYNKHRQCGIPLNEITDTSNRWQLQPKYVSNLGPNSNAFITDVCCGLRHNLCLSKKGKLYVFGSNDMGQLAMGITMHRIDNGLLHPYFASENDKILIKIDCGKNHSLCLDSKGNCYVFGHNSYGQMGTDQWDDSFECIREPKLFQSIKKYEDYVFSGISCGGDHSVLIRDVNGDKEIIAFGHNNYGQVTCKTRDECITEPHKITRKDIKCETNEKIVGVCAGWESTLIICQST